MQATASEGAQRGVVLVGHIIPVVMTYTAMGGSTIRLAVRLMVSHTVRLMVRLAVRLTVRLRPESHK